MSSVPPLLVSTPQRLCRIFVYCVTSHQWGIWCKPQMSARLVCISGRKEKKKRKKRQVTHFWASFHTLRSLTEQKTMHSSPRAVASYPHLTANRVAVVLLGPRGHFLFLCLLTVLWVNMGQALTNFKEHLSHAHTNSIIVSFFGLVKPCPPVWPDSPVSHHHSPNC